MTTSLPSWLSLMPEKGTGWLLGVVMTVLAGSKRLTTSVMFQPQFSELSGTI
ncbi:hypothetical protein D3C75_588040 [compost metagenome]